MSQDSVTLRSVEAPCLGAGPLERATDNQPHKLLSPYQPGKVDIAADINLAKPACLGSR